MLEPIALVLFFVTIFAYMKNYRIFTFASLSAKATDAKSDSFSPEKALLVIKEKLELGIITEEEYQAQRAEIISKL